MNQFRSKSLVAVALGTTVLLSACAVPEPMSPNVPSYESSGPTPSAPSNAPSYPARAGRVVEPRYASDGRTIDVCYHPARQMEWFPLISYESIASAAAIYLGETWAALPDDVIARLWSN